MGVLGKTFEAVDVGDGGDGRWAERIRGLWPRAERALAPEAFTPDGAATARRMFEQHMPELVPALDQLARQVGEARGETFLTLAALRPFYASCTQTGGHGVLLRNYDFDPGEVEGLIVRSSLLRPVLGTQDGGWGLLDGMNDAGLAVSLTFGGREVHGPGFAIIIVLRYLLETCDTVDQALARLASIPICVPQNVTLVDPGRAVTVYTGPDIPMTEAREAPDVAEACAANHQHLPMPEGQERFSRTQERLAAIRAAGADVSAMLKPPLYQDKYDSGLGTVYTALYRPGDGDVTYYWPGESWDLSLRAFVPGTRTVTLGLGA
jgi:predicted choloylglycine hydrolase